MKAIINKWIKLTIKKENGGTLAFVIILLMVLSIFTASILMVFNNNLKQAKQQEDSMEAYYLAYSGVEVAYAALLADGNEKLKELTRLTSPVASHVTNNVAIGGGEVDLIAVKSSDTGFVGWIKISSVATLTKNGQTYTRILYFDPADPTKKVWSNN